MSHSANATWNGLCEKNGTRGENKWPPISMVFWGLEVVFRHNKKIRL